MSSLPSGYTLYYDDRDCEIENLYDLENGKERNYNYNFYNDDLISEIRIPKKINTRDKLVFLFGSATIIATVYFVNEWFFNRYGVPIVQA